MPLFYVTLLVVSTCGLVFELLGGAAATYLLGDSTTQYATVIGAHLTAMGIGAALSRRIETRLADRFLDVVLGLALFGGSSVAGLFLAYVTGAPVRLVLYLFVAASGVFLGATLPLAIRVLRRRVVFRELVARAFAVDYAGGLLGAVLFGIVLLPRLGMMRAALFFGTLAAAAAFLGTWFFAGSLADVRGARVRASIVLALLAGGTIGSLSLVSAADQATYSDPVIFAEQTPYQRLVLTRGHGGVNLFLDGNLQFASVDEYRYHEALVHPALASAVRRERILVLGGGDGLAVREILRWQDVQSVTLVDLDGAMTTLARTHPTLRALNEGSLDDPRVTVLNEDAMVWLAETNGAPFDVAVVDFPDPNNFAVGKLYTSRFYRLLRARLAPDATVVVQSTSPLAARRGFWRIVSTLEAVGFHARPYHAAVPSFGEWGWVLATLDDGRPFAKLPPTLRFLTDDALPSLFLFPPDMARLELEPNRLNNQALVHDYDEEWQRWVH